jgi:transcriptional regulator NrdR family protein
MADIVTGTVTGQVDLTSVLKAEADIRRETAMQADAGRYATAENAFKISDKIDNKTDRVTDQSTAYFIAAQAQQFSTATALASLTAQVNAQNAATLAAIELNAVQTASAAQLASALLGQQLVADGATTRSLINEQKVADLRFAEMYSKFAHHHDRDGRGHRDECCPARPVATQTFGPATSTQIPVLL